MTIPIEPVEDAGADDGAAQPETGMRRNCYTGKYALSKTEFLSAKYFALRYKEWKDKYQVLSDTSKAISYDQDRVQSSGDYDPTETTGIRMAELSRNIGLIEDTVREAGAEIYKWMLLGVTDEGATYNYLRMSKGIPCGKNMYFEKRRKFYYLLSKKI